MLILGLAIGIMIGTFLGVLAMSMFQINKHKYYSNKIIELKNIIEEIVK